jgi:type I restriction enzyme M protein
MSRKRDVLDRLKRDELLAAVDRLALEVSDRRVREGLVDALAGSRRAGLAKARELSQGMMPIGRIRLV